ncbi:hypothetical protein CkaCkLH20_00500 [Colletotrichum karsti]|uniref:CFEM domain-containing protein n=1 Tax=Colletotrichum karsti TaxID=1095194 RepID=A0A9P6LNE6_9PEZI|nr:uncharacterized protein CkaCkLH20_00500 [Colletotrichum karsti]KAF9882464.1 hypothetical protein CkaCkLH20_00500 [Colletotrichum karsti]
MRRRIWLHLVASAALLGRACAQLDTLPPCGISCVNTVIAKGFGCASQDNACLCKQQDFVFGVRDCASQSCGADVAPKVNEFVTALCATATQAPPASTQAPASQPPSSPPAPATTPPPAPQSTSQPPPPQATTAKPSVAETPSSQPVNSPPPSAASNSGSEVVQATQLPTAAPTTLSTSTKATTTKSATSTSTGSPPSQSGSASDSDAEKVNATDGLSVPAKAGIGAAAGVGVIAIALALWLLIRRPRNRTHSMQISGPMPGSGRDYSGGIVGMTGKNFSELEMRSRRYEDMVPRQTPRRMI